MTNPTYYIILIIIYFNNLSISRLNPDPSAREPAGT